jgi:hypothetical protein
VLGAVSCVVCAMLCCAVLCCAVLCCTVHVRSMCAYMCAYMHDSCMS